MRQVPLTQGRVALVDDEDYPHVSRLKWCWDGYGYAIHRNGPDNTVRLHRFLMLPDPERQVDHVNGDGLDNRRANLRLASHEENCRNQRKTRGTSRFKGVSRSARGWYVTIKHKRRQYNLGHYDDEVTAAHVYDAAARRLHGAFARPNFPEETT